MSAENVASAEMLPPLNQSGRHTSPSPAGLRHRPLRRAATLADMSARFDQRKGSFLSDVPSETKRSLLSSTDDFLLPRVRTTEDEPLESSHWHSVPLGLALLPAVGGLFFQNGSAFITDVTLLGLAALFLNWSVRLPWDWYHAAQEVIIQPEISPAISPIEEERLEDEIEVKSPETIADPITQAQDEAKSDAARRELRTHELLALAACFVFPAFGAWLLHHIRAQLSRPSEGLVSNYNLTIFLLASEVRPLSHLIKLVQRRTLFLQRLVSASALKEQGKITDNKLDDLSKRLDELESHAADSIAAASKSPAEVNQTSEALVAKAAAKANIEMRKQVQPELDALNRAMRRYEKRMTISAVQIEARLQDLETKVQDVVVLAAAAQRSADKQQRNYLSILMNWASAIIVVPVQQLLNLLSLPGKMLNSGLNFVQGKLGISQDSTRQKDGKNVVRPSAARQRPREKKPKPT